MKTATFLSALVFLVFVLAIVPSVDATILTFNIRNAPANTTLATANTLMSSVHPNYGDNVSSLTQTDGSFVNNYLMGTGFTPNITLDYSSASVITTNGGGQKFYYEGGNWPGGVDFLHGSGGAPAADRKHYITLTPAVGFGVQLESFNLFGYAASVNHTVLWKVRAGSIGGTVLDSGTATVTANETSPLLVTTATTAYMQTIVLELHHSVGSHGALAMDNLSFSQVAVPEPLNNILVWIGSIAAVRIVRRRRVT